MYYDMLGETGASLSLVAHFVSAEMVELLLFCHSSGITMEVSSGLIQLMNPAGESAGNAHKARLW
jgi:hypothetical protein